MCTITWAESPEGLEIFFNRDEQRTRLSAEAPGVHLQYGVKYLAAIDGPGGGTWLAANEYGLAVAILNYYAAQVTAPVPDPASRGRLVTRFMACQSPGEVEQEMTIEKVANYRGFILLAFQRRQEVLQFTWDGRSLEKETRPFSLQVLSTSSVKTEQVLAYRYQAYRRQVLDQGLPDREAHKAYHHSQHPEDPAYSVCMAREDARTVSFSHLVLGEDIQLSYEADAQGVQVHLDTIDAVQR